MWSMEALQSGWSGDRGGAGGRSEALCGVVCGGSAVRLVRRPQWMGQERGAVWCGPWRLCSQAGPETAVGPGAGARRREPGKTLRGGLGLLVSKLG